MRIVFLGTPQFALPCLELLIKSDEEIAAVVTKPDASRGRGRKVVSPPVKLLANKHNLSVFQPPSVNQADFIEKITQLKPDLFVVAAFGEILSPELLRIPVYGGINVHASLLPKYRGGAPVNWAIINGEVKTGVTVMKMEEKLDRGGIISRKETDIFPNDDAVTLKGRLSLLGKEVLKEALDLIKRNEVVIRPQDETEVSFAPNFKKEDGLINWEKKALEIHNLVRGTIPWPGAYTHINLSSGRGNLKICKTKLVELEAAGESKPGKIVSLEKNGWKVAAGQGLILVKEVQIAGGKKLSAYDFSLGHGIKEGMRLG
ncbi:MAG: methionyl-tRNA formyltransferase [Candidatus Ratteibacteria bacterium]|nr:methionyl-tRNA formyltransferase [Candidatus Ratteibacteria bacterium]